MIDILNLTDEHRHLVQPAWLASAEPVHRELRPNLEADYFAQMRRIFEHGAEMIAATDGEAVVGVAVYRMLHDTAYGYRMYVDDLVTTAACRSQGVGKQLLDWLRNEARRRGAREFTLSSGTQRTAAHRFYFREGLVIPSFNFKVSL